MASRPHSGWLALAAAAALAAALPLASCGDDGDPSTYPADGGDRPEAGNPALDGLVSIAVTPESVDLTAGDVNGTQAFTAKGTFKDGSQRDITSVVTWRASPDGLLSADGATARATGVQGGDGSMAAAGNTVTGAAKVHVKYSKTFYADGAPAGSLSRFGGADDPTLAPAVVYPLDGALVPPNFSTMEIQWKPGAGAADLYDVVFSAPTLDLHVVTPCVAGGTAGCTLALPAAAWTAITKTMAGADPLSLRVRATGPSNKVGSSAPLAMQLAKTNIQGGLYYFNTYPDNGEKAGVYRYDFEKNEVGPFYTAGNCAGCHALSQDGTKMLAPICDKTDCARPMQLAVVDVATKAVVTPSMPAGDTDTVAWSPDNKFFVTTPSCATYAGDGTCQTDSGGVLRLFDAQSLTKISDAPTTGALFPAFSASGTMLAYARGETYRGPLSMLKSSIRVLDFDPTKSPPTWGAERVLVPSSGVDFENNYYPAFSPDDAWIAFARSTCSAGDKPNGDINESVCDTYDDGTARVFAVSSKGGAPVELARANGAGRQRNSWPKWSPFKGTYKDGEVLWLTFSSARDYGLRVTHAKDAQGNPLGHVQLWVVAFDPAKAAAGKDPSFAPVWLPFQSDQSSNHIGQWTTKIVGPVK